MRSITGSKSYDKEIKVGEVVNLGIDNMISLQDYPSGDQFTVTAGTANYKYSGVLTVKNLNNAIPTTYSWSKIMGSSGTPTISWSANGNKVVVESKGKGGSITLLCTATSGCAVSSREYTFYMGIPPL